MKFAHGGPIYTYAFTVTCDICGDTQDYTVISVNPHKTAMTFKPNNPLTGLGGMESRQKLVCGHYKDMEGYPVTRL